ncbi:hypothetical protein [Altererythrobacter sp. GH1-8]|uniref:hypothetical protein n=1 Tax=Altererythrobacter sp. GH1-8 TaxID=3349333 RepID=UPI00374D4FC8
MNSLLAWSGSVALALPLLAANAPAPAVPDILDAPVQLDPQFRPLTKSEQLSEEGDRLEALYLPQVQHQVRIEQRVVIRISPAARAPRSNLMAEQTQPRAPQRFEERKMDDCIALKDISGVQPGSGNRLVLYMDDRTMISAQLDKSCRARDFYSGFYVERNEDGKLCVARDKLQSRSGPNCELTRMRRLVPVDT